MILKQNEDIEVKLEVEADLMKNEVTKKGIKGIFMVKIAEEIKMNIEIREIMKREILEKRIIEKIENILGKILKIIIEIK